MQGGAKSRVPYCNEAQVGQMVRVMGGGGGGDVVKLLVWVGWLHGMDG